MDADNFGLHKMLKVFFYVIMLSSLYVIDVALGRGFASSFVKFICRFKCLVQHGLSTMPSMDEILQITNGRSAVTLLVAEIITFACIMMLAGKARDRSEKKIDEFLIESKTRLQKTYSSIEKWKKKKGIERSQVDPTKQNTACGDGLTKCLSPSEKRRPRHLFYPMDVDEGDVVRISGDFDDVDIDCDSRLLYDLSEEENVIIDDFYM